MRVLSLSLVLAAAAPLALAAPTPADLGDRLPVVMGAIVPLGQLPGTPDGQQVTVEGRIVAVQGRTATIQDRTGAVNVAWGGEVPAGVGRSVRVVGRLNAHTPPYLQVDAQDSMVLLDHYQGTNRYSGLQSGVIPPPAYTQISVPAPAYSAPAPAYQPPVYTPPQPPETINGYLPGQVPPGGWEATNYGYPAPPPQLIQPNPVYGQVNQQVWMQNNAGTPVYQDPSWEPTPPPGPPPSYIEPPASQPLPQSPVLPESSVAPPAYAPPASQASAPSAGFPLAQITSAIGGERVTVEGTVLSALPGAENAVVLQDASGTALVVIEPNVTLLAGSHVRISGEVSAPQGAPSARIIADEVVVLR